MFSGAGALLPLPSPGAGHATLLGPSHLIFRKGLVIPALPASQHHCDGPAMSCFHVKLGARACRSV